MVVKKDTNQLEGTTAIRAVAELIFMINSLKI